MQPSFSSTKPVLYGVWAVLALLVGFGSFVTVGHGDRGVLMNFGAISGTILSPGLHFKVPIMQSVKDISVQIQKKAAVESAASKDLQVVTTTAAVNFGLDPNKVDVIYKNIGDLAAVEHKIIDPTVSDAVKAVTAQYNADELITNREKVRAEIEDQVKSVLATYDVIVNRVNITEFNFSKDYDRAIESKQVAQQRAQQSNYELQQVKIDSQKQVVQAQADAEAQIATAKGQARATVLKAKAEAEAMSIKNRTITQKVLQLTAIQQWNGQPPSVVMGSKGVPFIDLGRFAGNKK